MSLSSPALPTTAASNSASWVASAAFGPFAGERLLGTLAIVPIKNRPRRAFHVHIADLALLHWFVLIVDQAYLVTRQGFAGRAMTWLSVETSSATHRSATG